MTDSGQQPLYNGYALNIGLASEFGQVERVRRLLNNKYVNPAAQDNHALCYASKNGHEEIVKLLLSNARVNPAARLYQSMRWACQKGHIGVVRLLLNDVRPLSIVAEHAKQTIYNRAFAEACRNGHNLVARLFLSEQPTLIDPTCSSNEALRSAIDNGHLDVVRELLGDSRVDPTTNDNYSLRSASARGYINIVQLLLGDFRINPALPRQESLMIACQCGHGKIVELLLSDDRVNPWTTIDQKDVRVGTEMPTLYIGTLGINNGHANPYQDALKMAIECGHEHIVKILFADSRITLGRKQQALLDAILHNQVGVLHFILGQRPRINPAFHKNLALRTAIRENQANVRNILLSQFEVYSTCALEILSEYYQKVSPTLIKRWAFARPKFPHASYGVNYELHFLKHIPSVLCNMIYEFLF